MALPGNFSFDGVELYGLDMCNNFGSLNSSPSFLTATPDYSSEISSPDQYLSSGPSDSSHNCHEFRHHLPKLEESQMIASSGKGEIIDEVSCLSNLMELENSYYSHEVLSSNKDYSLEVPSAQLPICFPKEDIETDIQLSICYLIQAYGEAIENGQLAYGDKEKIDYIDKARPLYKAASKGAWEDAEIIFNKYPDTVRAYITEGLETPLHIAALENQAEFVKKFVGRIKADRKVLAITNDKGITALGLAAVSGNVEIAKLLIEGYPELRLLCGAKGTLPVMIAAMLGDKAMVETLWEPLDSTFWTGKGGAEVLKECISSGLFGIARELIEAHPGLAFFDTEVVAMLAKKPMAEKSQMGKCGTFLGTFFGSGMKEADSPETEALELFKYILDLASGRKDLNIENIVETATRLLFDAAEQGNFHCFKLLIDSYPELVWKSHANGVSIFHFAVMHHHESIFALLDNMESVRRLVTIYVNTETGDNMLHLAATLAPNDKLNTVTGAAFQMQQAICWYKAVEKIVPPSYKNLQNVSGSTPADIFDHQQKSLLDEGEKWMKATAKSCMLVAALNATVMFTSAFTVPGGNDNEGHPYLLNKVCFQLFSVSEVIGMFSSSTSILMFLSILTSRVNKYAFQRSLPFKLMIGVAALFVSIASMVIAFCATTYLSYGHDTWVPGLLLLFSFVPILFIILKFHLLVDIIHSTFVSRFLFRSRNLLNP